MPHLFLKAREPFSSYSHFLGAVLSGAGLALILLRMLYVQAHPLTILSVTLFCLSLIALYAASSCYHFFGRGESALRVLKKLDHSMIYVLIAGSYTPILLRFMAAPKCYTFTAAVWAIALTGIAIKLLWIDAPRFIGTILYLLLGWAIAADFNVVLSMPKPAFWLLAAGGLSYTIGGVIYIAKRPNFSATLGFHEIFHLFVLAGSIFHYLLVFFFVA